MWAHAYRDSSYYAAVDTNNGTESLNKALKYSYLPRQKSLTLSGIVALLIDRFLPDMWQKYVFQNYKLSEEYRAYTEEIPGYLKGRPKSVIFHCLERKAKCLKFTKDDIEVLGDGRFEASKTSNGKHTIDFFLPECSCKDWARYHIPCKHFFAVFEHCPGWDWYKLPQHFQGSSYLSADTTAVQKYLSPANPNADQRGTSHYEDVGTDHESLPQNQKGMQWCNNRMYFFLIVRCCRDHHW